MEFEADRELPQDHDDLSLSRRPPAPFHALRLARFQIKHFEPEAVAFDTASGDTHFLAPHTVALLQLIQNNPGMTRDAIEPALAARLSLPISPDFSQMTDEALASLRQIGMLETP